MSFLFTYLCGCVFVNKSTAGITLLPGEWSVRVSSKEKVCVSTVPGRLVSISSDFWWCLPKHLRAPVI